MWIFVRNIPASTSQKELHQFVSDGLKSRWALFSLFSQDHVNKCEIIAITDKDSHATEYHGLVELDSSLTGQKAISKLNGQRLKRRPVGVRPYFKRMTQHDRRRFSQDIIDERRQNDRRRPHIEVGRVDNIKTEALVAFRRIHN